MKRYLILGIVLLLSGISIGQEVEKKSQLIVSMGASSFNSEKQHGVVLSNELIADINRFFAYGGKLFAGFAQGRNEEDYPFEESHISTIALDLNMFFTPLKSERHELLLGLGVAFQYDKTSTNMRSNMVVPHILNAPPPESIATFSIIEPIMSLHYYYALNEKLSLGANANIRDLSFNQYIIGAGIGISI
jgi:hypothetical protein